MCLQKFTPESLHFQAKVRGDALQLRQTLLLAITYKASGNARVYVLSGRLQSP